MLHKTCLCHFFFNFVFTYLLDFLMHWESQCGVDRLWKKLLYIFLRIVDINDKFNVRSTISYYNVKHIKATIMTPYCHTTFRLLAHVSLLQYCRSSNMLSFRKNLAHISAWYPSISSWWTQWVKNNNRPNYSQELKRVLAWPSSHYSNYPWSFFFSWGILYLMMLWQV